MKQEIQNPIFRTYLFAAVIVFLFFSIHLVNIFVLTDPEIKQVVSDIVTPLTNLLCSFGLFWAAKSSYRRSKKLGHAWGILFISQLLYTLGDVIWTIYELGFGLNPNASIADIAYLACYPIFLLGVFYLPTRENSAKDRWKSLIDMAIVMVAALLVFWNFVIGPIVLDGSGTNWVDYALSLAYPSGDLVLLWASLLLLYRRANHQNGLPLVLLSAGALIMVITDSIYSIHVSMDTFAAGQILDLGWFLTYVLFGFAGITQAMAAKESPRFIETEKTQNSNSPKLQRILTYFTYVWLIAAYALLVISELTPLPMDFLLLASGVAVVIALVLVRQAVTLVENQELNQEMSLMLHKLQRQADELGKTNLNLQTEIHEREHAEERLAHDALHDGLTGLANRTLFLDRLGQAIEYTRRRPEYSFSVFFLDLDQFKIVNDSLGHTAGDRILVEISARFKKCLRTSDTIARLGGDEFVVLLENTSDEEGILITAARLQNVIKQPFSLDGHEVFLSTSIGIVQSLVNYEQPQDVLRDADIAMYRAKDLGKARSEIFSPSLRTLALARLNMENELRNALEAEDLFLNYQPIFTINTRKLIGFEALLRWQHPLRGLVPPSEFISVAEDSGLIIPIGKWVLQEACRQMKTWNDTRTDFGGWSISVNISSKQFAQADFVEQVRQVLNQTGLSPTSLKLEITESLIIDNRIKAKEIFHQLRQMGIQLEIDDFGTGYSSLSYLQDFPVNTIKIDKSFIQEIGENSRVNELIRAIITMARGMGMDTTAEGVETIEQLEELKRLDCINVQGFLLSRPVDSHAATQLLGIDDKQSVPQPSFGMSG